MFKRKYYLFNYTNYEKKILFSAPMRALVNTVKRIGKRKYYNNETTFDI
jgi:hypothetical protein